MRRFKVILHSNPDGGYTVIVPVLPGCVTQGDTIPEALDNAREAIELTLEDMRAHGEVSPEDVLVEEEVCQWVYGSPLARPMSSVGNAEGVANSERR